MKDKESLYPYYFKSMSYFDEVTKSERKTKKKDKKDSGINLDMKENIKNNYFRSFYSETISKDYENYNTINWIINNK
ncbi:hypothetical protein H8356DRAFT_1356779 [Neocallimastix lanati (nom. inval.)]|nr:hypothetical protein H8356DRAFT_1356779 [Neocallimastix sp. JGI-2020a]